MCELLVSWVIKISSIKAPCPAPYHENQERLIFSTFLTCSLQPCAGLRLPQPLSLDGLSPSLADLVQGTVDCAEACPPHFLLSSSARLPPRSQLHHRQHSTEAAAWARGWGGGTPVSASLSEPPPHRGLGTLPGDALRFLATLLQTISPAPCGALLGFLGIWSLLHPPCTPLFSGQPWDAYIRHCRHPLCVSPFCPAVAPQ